MLGDDERHGPRRQGTEELLQRLEPARGRADTDDALERIRGRPPRRGLSAGAVLGHRSLIRWVTLEPYATEGSHAHLHKQGSPHGIVKA